MALKLDLYDKKILFELDTNARRSTAEIGRKIRKSKQFVDYRIKKLEEEKLIKGYNTVIDYSKLGYTSVRIYFKFHDISPIKQRELEDELIQDKEVWWLVTVEGHWNLAYAMAVKNILDFYEYWNKITAKYREFILDKSVVIYTHIKQYPKSFLIEKENSEKETLIGASKEVIQINKIDRDLLKILSNQARMSLLDIAERLETSPKVIRSHIKKLEKLRIIQGYRLLIDISLLGYRWYKIYINFKNTTNFIGLELFCAKHANLLNTNKTIGGSDFEIELVAKSFTEFQSIIDDLREKFVGMIDSYEYVIAREEKKMSYFPFET